MTTVGATPKRELLIPRTLLVVKIRKLSTSAKTPVWAGQDGIGFFIYPDMDYNIKRNCYQICSTKLSLRCTAGYYFKIVNVFTHELEYPFSVEERVFNSTYGRELKMSVINRSNADFLLSKETPIAQIVIEKTILPTLMVS